ncbi:MAG: cytochrome C oxidase assembly protein [Bacteroidetes bacterium]|nr:MAG: cytochrome C oxidase assembly protein [Bacteroidota bacterium]
MDTTYILLQQYWWFLVSVLGALLVFLLFVQGGQTFIHTLGRDEMERTMLVNALGRKWEFTFTTLVTFGGAFFASFPLFYSTSFGGAYWVWMAILFCFVIQAVAYEYRTKPKNVLGKKTFEAFLLINGVLGTVLLGTAVGTFFTGSDFFVGKMNLTNLAQPVISYWGNPWHGLEAVLDVRNVMLGLAVCFLARCLGLMYFINLIDYQPLYERAKRKLLYNAIPFLVFFLGFLISILLSKGYAVDPDTGKVYLEQYKYFWNLLEMPAVLAVLLVGVVLVLWGLISIIFMGKKDGIWFGGLGTFLTVLALLLNVGYNNTAYYPSFDLQSSLTIYNSSSSKFTLTAMSIVSLLIPFVLGYIWYAWKKMDAQKMTPEEIASEKKDHVEVY